MANEIRVLGNFLSGTITNNPLASGGTTLNSANLANLEAIDSTEFAPIILDPLGAGNGPEIAYITAHTAAATSATIVRGREGTTGVEHASGTAWVLGPVRSWFRRIVTSAPSGSGEPWDGQEWYHHTEKRLYTAEAGAGVRMGWTTSAGRTGGTWTRSANQSINSASLTAISWDAETFDSDGFCTPTSSTITIPSGLGGLYAVTARVTHAWANAGSLEEIQIVCSTAGTYIQGWDASHASALGLGLSIGPLPLAAAETITVNYLQGTGGAQNVTGRIDVYRIGA